jgi:hypothetical protein
MMIHGGPRLQKQAREGGSRTYLSRSGDEQVAGLLTHNLLDLFSVLLMWHHKQRLQSISSGAACQETISHNSQLLLSHNAKLEWTKPIEYIIT